MSNSPSFRLECRLVYWATLLVITAACGAPGDAPSPVVALSPEIPVSMR